MPKNDYLFIIYLNIWRCISKFKFEILILIYCFKNKNVLSVSKLGLNIGNIQMEKKHSLKGSLVDWSADIRNLDIYLFTNEIKHGPHMGPLTYISILSWQVFVFWSQ